MKSLIMRRSQKMSQRKKRKKKRLQKYSIRGKDL